MSDPQWADGKPSYSVAITAEEALEEIQAAANVARDHYADRDKRIRLSLAMAWLEHMMTERPDYKPEQWP